MVDRLKETTWPERGLVSLVNCLIAYQPSLGIYVEAIVVERQIKVIFQLIAEEAGKGSSNLSKRMRRVWTYLIRWHSSQGLPSRKRKRKKSVF